MRESFARILTTLLLCFWLFFQPFFLLFSLLAVWQRSWKLWQVLHARTASVDASRSAGHCQHRPNRFRRVLLRQPPVRAPPCRKCSMKTAEQIPPRGTVVTLQFLGFRLVWFHLGLEIVGLEGVRWGKGPLKSGFGLCSSDVVLTGDKLVYSAHFFFQESPLTCQNLPMFRYVYIL